MVLPYAFRLSGWLFVPVLLAVGVLMGFTLWLLGKMGFCSAGPGFGGSDLEGSTEEEETSEGLKPPGSYAKECPITCLRGYSWVLSGIKSNVLNSSHRRKVHLSWLPGPRARRTGGPVWVLQLSFPGSTWSVWLHS